MRTRKHAGDWDPLAETLQSWEVLKSHFAMCSRPKGIPRKLTKEVKGSAGAGEGLLKSDSPNCLVFQASFHFWDHRGPSSLERGGLWKSLMSYLRFKEANCLTLWRELVEREEGEGSPRYKASSHPACLLAFLSAPPLILKSRGWHKAPGSTGRIPGWL